MQTKSGSTHCYDDIITLPHHTSTAHFPMPQSDRAAQFAPFAALTGHEAALRETARLTDEQRLLDEDRIARLDRRLQLLLIHRQDRPTVSVTYFKPDNQKSGGQYITVSGRFVKVIYHTSELLLDQLSPIPLRHICNLESALFDRFDEPK